MTIRHAIKSALADGPMTAYELAVLTGNDRASIQNALNYLHADGAVRKIDGKFALPLIKTPPPQMSRLTGPAYVPPKATHRPVYDVAPGIVLREGITGRPLADRRVEAV